MSTSQCENSHNLTEYLTFCAQIVVFCCLGVFLSLCVWTHKIHRKCRAPPANLNFQKIQIGGKGKWHITTEKRNASGGSGKRRKKRFYGHMALMKISLKKSVSMTGPSLIQTVAFTGG